MVSEKEHDIIGGAMRVEDIKDFNYSDKEERDALVIRLYSKGFSCYKIARLLNIHRHTVTRVLKNNNISRRKIGDYHRLRHEKIRELYLSGKSIQEIAAELKISSNTVERVLEKMKIIFEKNERRIIRIAKYIELKKDGKTKEEIAKILGMTTRQLNRLVFNSPINITNIKNKKYSKKPLSNIITDFIKGSSITDLSKRYGMNQSELKDLLRKFGLYKL